MTNGDINLSEVYKNAVDQENNTQSQPELTEEEIRAVIAQRKAMQEVQEQPSVIENDDEIVIKSNGGGMVIEHLKEAPAESPIKVGLDGKIKEDVSKYLEDMDKELQEKEENLREAMEEQRIRLEEQNNEEENINQSFNQDQFDKVTVVLDKIGMGSVEFTPEERIKLEKAKVIRLEEVETVSLESIKVKRNVELDVKKLLSKKNSRNTTSVVLPTSGYTAVLAGCSLFEISNFIIDKDNVVENQLSKWNLIYTKIVDSSIKFKNFDHFLKSTAVTDYNVLVYGILCASYPEEDEITLRCTEKDCPGIKDRDGKKNTEYPYKYLVRSLLRPERMTEGLFEKVKTTIDSSYTEEDAKRNHESSDAITCKRIKLPDSEFVIELGIETAHDLIYNAARAFSNLEDDTYRESLTTSTAIRRCFIPDEDGAYFEIEDKTEIAKIVYQLSDIDIKVIMKITQEISKDISIDFGFVEVRCPYCGKISHFIPIEVEDILFLKYRQAAQID